MGAARSRVVIAGPILIFIQMTRYTKVKGVNHVTPLRFGRDVLVRGDSGNLLSSPPSQFALDLQLCLSPPVDGEIGVVVSAL